MRVGLGCARLGSAARVAGRRGSIRLVHAALDSGVTYFDTADAYGAGASEEVLGRALAGRRSEVILATKGGYRFTERGPVQRRVRAAGRVIIDQVRRVQVASERAVAGSAYASQDFSPPYLTSALHASLRRLATDHIDVYQLHGPRDADPDAIAEWASTMVGSGKIGRLGIGAETLDQVRAWSACPAVASVQLPFGLLDVEAGAELIPAVHSSGRAVIVRGVLGAGLLGDSGSAGPANAHKLPLIETLRSIASDAGSTVVAMAVDFVRARTDVDTMLVGTRSPQHLADIAAMMYAPPPDPSLLASIDAALAAHPVVRP